MKPSKARRSERPPAPKRPEPDPRPVLLRQSLSALGAELQRHGFRAFRAKQIYHWLYKHSVESVEQMRNLPQALRAWLGEFYRFGGCAIVERREARDGSVKLVFELWDGNRIEAVLMREDSRRTLCISSQVGCPLGCRFCMTGVSGFVRDCSSDEILGQYLAASREFSRSHGPITHIVFMGMGEPFLNCEAVFDAVRRLTDPQAVGISPRRITLSTAGLIEGIKRLGEADLGVNLAVSLNASNEDQRMRLMPWSTGNRLHDIVEACRRFPLANRRRITFEYVLLENINDSPADARRLGKLLRGIKCKINLIPFNPVPGILPFRRPSERRIDQFRQILLDMNYTVSVRYSKGPDIGAACGQLAAHAGAQLLYDTRKEQEGIEGAGPADERSR